MLTADGKTLLRYSNDFCQKLYVTLKEPNDLENEDTFHVLTNIPEFAREFVLKQINDPNRDSVAFIPDWF